jgi:pimeloyl-ACP methyl ester carboxylesterase
VTAVAAPTPLVLVHGWAGSAQSWEPIVDALDRTSFDPIIAVRLPHSPGWSGTAEATIGAAADELVDVLAGLPSPAVAVGHSMGAQVTLAAHARRPDLVIGEVVIDPAYGAEPSVVDEMHTWAGEILDQGHRAVLGFFTQALGNDVPSDVRARVLDDVRATPSGVIARYLLSEYVDDGALGIAPNTLSTAQRRVSPVLALQATADGVRRESALPAPAGSRIERWRGLSHFLHLEQPRRFAELLESWRLEVEELRAERLAEPETLGDLVPPLPPTRI